MKQKIINIFLVFSLFILFTGFAFLYYELNTSKRAGIEREFRNEYIVDEGEAIVVAENIDKEIYLTEGEIDKKISQALSTISGETKTIIREVTTDTSKNITYISIGDPYATTSTSWVDISGSAVYIDIETDYGSGAKVSWEASLKVAHPNGKVFARLYDDTHKIAVDLSEISTENISYTQISSGFLPFWKGRNLYKVQVKSLNSFEVSYTGGKVKIAY